MEFEGLAGDGGREGTRGEITKVERKEDGDGLWMAVDIGGTSPSEESKICMTVYIPGSILTLTTRGVFKMEAEEWGGIRIFVDAFVEESGSPYTLYLLVQNSH